MLPTFRDFLLVSIYKFSIQSSPVERGSLKNYIIDSPCFADNSHIARALSDLFNRGLINKEAGRKRFGLIYITKKGIEKFKIIQAEISESFFFEAGGMSNSNSNKKGNKKTKERNISPLSLSDIEDITEKLEPIIQENIEDTIREFTEDFLPQESTDTLISDLNSTLQDEITIFLKSKFKDLTKIGS